MKVLMLTCMAAVVLSSCGKSNEPAAVSSVSNPSASVAKALPFTVEGAMLSDLFQNNLKVAKVDVGVDGGSAVSDPVV